MARRITLNEWFEKLVLNVLSYDVYLEKSKEECAYLVLERYMKSPERSWGWSWGSWLSNIFSGDEFYYGLSYEEKVKLDRRLFDYITKLAERFEKKHRK